MSARYALEKFDHLLWRGAVIDAHGQVETPQLIGEGPVGHFLRNEIRIGYDHFSPLPGPYDTCANANAAHSPLEVANLDRVAHVDGTLE